MAVSLGVADLEDVSVVDERHVAAVVRKLDTGVGCRRRSCRETDQQAAAAAVRAPRLIIVLAM
ncbi:hypothetical protein [Streptomyces koyangensis]